MVLVSSISNFFSNKISHANKWMRKKKPTCSNSALVFCMLIGGYYLFHLLNILLWVRLFGLAKKSKNFKISSSKKKMNFTGFSNFNYSMGQCFHAMNISKIIPRKDENWRKISLEIWMLLQNNFSQLCFPNAFLFLSRDCWVLAQ